MSLIERLYNWPATGQSDAFSSQLVGKMFIEAAKRIELLEETLRTTKEYVCDIHALRVINTVLEPEQNK